MAISEKERSAKNAIVAPRIFNYQRPGAGGGRGVVDTSERRASGCNGERPMA